MADPDFVPVVLSTAQESGCTNPQAVADFQAAMVFEARVKGLALGILVGLAGAVAVGVYVKSKGG